jgi:regulatory protein
VRDERTQKPRPPLDREGLERLALFYAGRYATTRAKLKSYLRRKVAERGWDGPGAPGEAAEALVERLSGLGYVNDRLFAESKAAALGRRGYGERRVRQALTAAGIGEEDSADARAVAVAGGWAAALRFAERKRIGPFAAEAPDRPGREKALGAMLRAGHPIAIARRLVMAPPGAIPESDGD